MFTQLRAYSRNSFQMLVASSLILAGSASIAQDDPAFGQAEDLDYAALIWDEMINQKLAGEDQIRVEPFVGNRPHGSIQEVLSTNATIDGHEGKIVVKRNHTGEGVTPKDVYSGEVNEFFEVYAVIFKREEGYFPDGKDWFWVEYTEEGDVLEFGGDLLAGRIKQGCVACHAAIGGEDLEVLTLK